MFVLRIVRELSQSASSRGLLHCRLHYLSQFRIVSGIVVHIAHGGDAETQRLLNAVDVAFESMDVRVNQTGHQSVARGGHDCACISDELAFPDLHDTPIFTQDESLVNEVVSGEYPDVLDNQSLCHDCVQDQFNIPALGVLAGSGKLSVRSTTFVPHTRDVFKEQVK